MSPVRSARSALQESIALKDSLCTSPASARVKQPQYASMGEYRPPVQAVSKPVGEENPDFQKMLAMIGEKVRQKFSKARDVFRFVDTDHSGTISRSEVHFFFRFFNVSSDLGDKFFDGFEVDEDGEISYVEFVKYLWPHINPGNEGVHWALKKGEEGYQEYMPTGSPPEKVFVRRDEEHDIELPNDLVKARVNIAQRLDLKYKNRRDAFRDLDYDRDGTISIEEMQGFFKLFGWEEVAERFYHILETKGHGEVHFDTFAQLFTLSKDSDMRLRL